MLEIETVYGYKYNENIKIKAFLIGDVGDREIYLVTHCESKMV